jgi:hypothetical protein
MPTDSKKRLKNGKNGDGFIFLPLGKKKVIVAVGRKIKLFRFFLPPIIQSVCI